MSFKALNLYLLHKISQEVERQDFDNYIADCVLAVSQQVLIKKDAFRFKELRDKRYGLNRDVLKTNDIIKNLKERYGIEFV